MNQRLQQFLSAENISQSQFADKIGVARASVSHILAGRNRPGFEFIESMSRYYPSLNLEWLITGKGRMYKEPAGSSLFEPQPAPEPQKATIFSGEEDDLFGNNNAYSVPETPATPQTTTNESMARDNRMLKRGISKIIVFFEDGTYQELK